MEGFAVQTLVRADWWDASGPEVAEDVGDDVMAAFKAAAICVQQTSNADDISQETGRSRAQVYRDLALAEKIGFLDRRPRLRLPRGPGAGKLLQEVMVSPLAEELRKRFRGAQDGPEFVVVPACTSKRISLEDAQLETSRRLGHAAASRLMRGILKQGVRVVGCSWGFHTGRLAGSIPAGVTEQLSVSEMRKIRVFGIHGSIGVQGADDALLSGNANAQRVVEGLNEWHLSAPGGSRQRQSPVPPTQVVTQPLLISSAIAQSEDGKSDDLGKYWSFMAEDRSVQAVFGRRWALGRAGVTPSDDKADVTEEKPLLERVHAIICGIGLLDQGLALRRVGIVSEQDISDLRRAGGIADVGGQILYEHPDAAREGDAVWRFNRRAVSPRSADLAAVTRRARETGVGIGTMVIARYPRTQAALAALRAGFVGVLVCDTELAEELLAAG